MRSRITSLMALLLIASCRSDRVVSPPVDQIISIPAGQRVTVPQAGLEIGFERVLAESRCPSDVVCVWEGEARLRFVVTKSRGISRHIDMSTMMPNDVARSDGYVLQLVTVTPYPEHAGPIPPSEYVAHLRIFGH